MLDFIFYVFSSLAKNFINNRYKKEISSSTTLLDKTGYGKKPQDSKKMKEYINYGLCPDCGEGEIYNGPEAGMSVNIACGKCGSEFNHNGFTCERIHVLGLTKLKSEVSLTPVIIREWIAFDFFHDRSKRAQTEKAREWCSENCCGNWASNRFYIYIQDDSDALAFKMVWT